MTVKSLAVTGCLAAALTALAANKPVAPARDARAARMEALELVKDLRGKASEAADYASQLQSIARFDYVSWQSHAAALQALKDDVNDMGRMLSQLEEQRHSVAPWEREATDRAAPLLKLMADNTQGALRFLNDHQGDLWLPAYQKYVDNLADESGRLSSSVGHSIQLAKVRAKEKHLEKILSKEAGD